MFAVHEGHKDIVQRLVSAGADVHIKDKVCGVMECTKYGLGKVPFMQLHIIIHVILCVDYIMTVDITCEPCTCVHMTIFPHCICT